MIGLVYEIKGNNRTEDITVNIGLMSDKMREQIEKGLAELGVTVASADVVVKMEQFIECLLEKNQVMNLTAIIEPKEVVGLHLLDSAAMLNFIPKEAKTLVDVGTGAGFPGVPLKILKSDLDVTLMDALEKRLNWLEEVSEELELEGIETLHGRGEELTHHEKYREVYDVATARAVADLRILAEIVLPFVKVGGYFLAMKSRDSVEEIELAEEVIKVLGGVVKEVTDYKIPHMDVEHRVVVIEKIASSPKKYPRRWAKIKNAPIGS